MNGCERLAEKLLRHSFSLQKITWNATTKTAIYRSKRHHNTKRNFEIFKAHDFIAAASSTFLRKASKASATTAPTPTKLAAKPHSSPTASSVLRNFLQINNPQSEIQNSQSEILLIPAPPKQSARDMRPLVLQGIYIWKN